MKKLLIALMLVISWNAFADVTTNSLQDAQEKFQKTFTNQLIVSFEKGPMDGLYEINAGGKIIYYNPDNELLIFGEIYTKDGQSLTAESIKKTSISLLDRLPMDQALVLGDKDGVPIIEFTDPDCPYCLRFNNYINSSNYKVKRIIFFDSRIHPSAQEKIIHILCAKDKEKAFKDVYNRVAMTYNNCEAGSKQAAAQQKASEDIGVSGTPTFILEGSLVTGFKKSAIEDYLSRKTRFALSKN